jgi:hypothetical protein
MSEEVKDMPNPLLIEFLDAETFAQKGEILRKNRENMTDRLINDMAVSIDAVITDGDIDTRFEHLKSYVDMRAKYECPRLR